MTVVVYSKEDFSKGDLRRVTGRAGARKEHLPVRCAFKVVCGLSRRPYPMTMRMQCPTDVGRGEMRRPSSELISAQQGN